MARKKTTASSSTPSAVEPQPAEQRSGATAGRRPRVGRKKAVANAAKAVNQAAPQAQPDVPDFAEEKKALEALRRHTHAAALQLAALRHQAQALNEELEGTRRQCLAEAKRLAEVRGETEALRSGLRQAQEDLAALSHQIAEARTHVAEQVTAPVQQIEREYAEARGRLDELRREANEAARTATALRTRSLEAAAEIAEAASEVRQTLQEAAEEAVEYANVSALLGAESDRTDEEANNDEPTLQEPTQLGVTVAADSGAVLEVTPDSPAARAGVTVGDVVVSANGETVTNGADLRRIISGLGSGREVVLRLERSGQFEEIRARLPETAGPSA
jgi:chromosome segregation ATPase